MALRGPVVTYRACQRKERCQFSEGRKPWGDGDSGLRLLPHKMSINCLMEL